MLFDTGYRKPICQLTVLDKSGVRLALLDQFMEGLKELHVLDLIKKYPELTKPFFVSERRKLTAGIHILLYYWPVFSTCCCCFFQRL